MEDKTFELLTQMYADFTAQFKEVKEDIKALKSNVLKIGVKIENDTDRKIGLLLDNLSSKVEKQDVEIRVIKSAK